MKTLKRKVVIVGAGAVGSSFAYALAREGAAEEIVLSDINRQLAEGEVLDLAHGLPFLPPVTFKTGSSEDYADAQVIVITAGAKQKPGQSRLDLMQENAKIIERIMADITSRNSPAIVIVVANPVDILARVALQASGWPRERIMGSGTVLDTARFRYMLSDHCGVDPRNVHGYILGEHGDSEIAPWSLTHIAGMPMDEYCAICRKCEDWHKTRRDLVERVRQSAYHIIDYKGATNYAIGLALVRIAGAILRNEHSVLTVSVLLDGEYGLHNVCLGVPCIISAQGVERVIHGKITDDEQKGLEHSAKVLSDAWKQLRGKSE
ncbi:MAG: L-lactate dehydrogenase [Verrucomicrobiota bacterium]